MFQTFLYSSNLNKAKVIVKRLIAAMKTKIPMMRTPLDNLPMKMTKPRIYRDQRSPRPTLILRLEIKVTFRKFLSNELFNRFGTTSVRDRPF